MNISPGAATIIAAIGSAIITAAVTLIISISTSKAQHAKYISELEKQNALVIYRLDQMEEKVSAHNHFDNRLVVLEQQVVVMGQQLKALLNKIV